MTTHECNALSARIDALQTLLNEREDRTKERFAAMDKSVTAALNAADKAVNKAEISTEKRFEGVNEFRETLRDQAANLMPRVEYTVQHKALTDLVQLNQERINALENVQRGGKASLAQLGAVIVGACLAGGSIGGLIMTIFSPGKDNVAVVSQEAKLSAQEKTVEDLRNQLRDLNKKLLDEKH